MATELVTYTWCDNHPGDEKVPGRTVPDFTLHGKTIDLCEVCEKEILEPVRLLFDERGAPSKDARAKQRRQCPDCDKVYYRASSLRSHIQRAHGDMLDLNPGAYACPDCERTFDTPQGRGAHRSKNHGYVAPAKAANA